MNTSTRTKILVSMMIAVQVIGIVAGLPGDIVQKGKCECAAFKSDEVSFTEPVMTKTPEFEIACDDAGKEDCNKMCFALAQAGKEKAAEIVCNAIKITADNLLPAVFSKACGAKEWSFTGLKATIPICCQEGKTVTCSDITTPEG